MRQTKHTDHNSKGWDRQKASTPFLYYGFTVHVKTSTTGSFWPITESTIGVNHVRSLLVVCLPALLLCHELQLGIAGQARGKFVADLLPLWHKMVGALFIAWLLGTLRTRWKVLQLPTLQVRNGHLNDVLSRERSWLVDGKQEGLWANQQQKEKNGEVERRVWE